MALEKMLDHEKRLFSKRKLGLNSMLNHGPKFNQPLFQITFYTIISSSFYLIMQKKFMINELKEFFYLNPWNVEKWMILNLDYCSYK